MNLAIIACVLVFHSFAHALAHSPSLDGMTHTQAIPLLKLKWGGDSRFLGFSSNNDLLEMRAIAGELKVGLRSWNIKDGKERWRSDESALPAVISPDGTLIVAANTILENDGSTSRRGFSAFRTADGVELFRTEKGLSNMFAFDLTGTKFIQTDLLGKGFPIWTVGAGKAGFSRSDFVKHNTRSIVPSANSLRVVFSPDIKHIVAIMPVEGQKRVIAFKDLRSAKTIWTSKPPLKSCLMTSFSPCGKWIVGSIGDNTTRIWDAENGSELKKIVHGEDKKFTNYCSHAISPNSKWLATGSGEGKASEVTLWELPTGKKLLTIPVNEGAIKTLAFNQRGDMLAAGSERALHVWALGVPKDAKK